MPLDFPTSPVLNQLYTFGGKTWKWDGAGWISYNIGLVGPYVISINGATGTISILGGTGIEESISGKTLSLSLETSGVISGTTGGNATIPIITVDSYGRITNLTSTSFIDAYNVRTQSSSSNIDLPFGLVLDSSTYGPILKDSAFTLNPATNTISFPGFTLTHSSSSVITSISNVSGGNKNLTVNPYGNVVIQPQSATSLTSLPFLTLSNSSALASLVGGDFYLGQKDEGFGSIAASIIFEGDTDNGFETTLSVIDPTADRTIYLPNASGTIALDNSVVTTFNGKTGAIQGVTGIYAGTGISVSGNTGNVTITNVGVLSINGITGIITNVATTNTSQTFTQLQAFSAGISASGGTFYGGVNLQNTLLINGSQGSSNQVLSSTGSGITWATASSGGGTKTYEVFTPLHNQPPASNYATVDTRNSIMVLEFDAATDESAVFVGVMPEAASLGSGLKIRIHWMADTAVSGTCRWGVQIERMNTDEDSDSFDTAATAGSTTNGTSGIITTTEITITTIDSVAAGEPFRLKVFRDADGTSGTDDMTGDAQLVAVEVRSAS